MVEQQLKSPSSAEHPGIFDNWGVASKMDDCSYRVKSWVDSQNGFGAMIRSTYIAEMHGDSDEGTWRGRIVAFQ